MPSKPKIVSALLLCAITSNLTWAQAPLNREEPGFGPDPRVSKGPVAPLLPGMGGHSMKITTSSDQAQKFFDQGLALTYAYNHAEAKRAFQEAARLDPDCAMAYWGWALVLGPNLNLPMLPENVEEANWALREAIARKANATEMERAFIEALATRYSPQSIEHRADLDGTYSDAMEKVYEQYPDDADAATLYVASIMNTMPWNYWMKDRQPRPMTARATSILEETIAQHPEHAGALHFYVHIVEEHFPDKAEASADTLLTVMPGSGHLLHMPSHIYMRVGRYADAYESNRLAVLADEGYITACREQGMYPAQYYPHNIHFMAWAAQREGRSEEALKTARKVGNKARESADLGAVWALHQSFYSMPMYMMIRFGKWDDILKEPTPPKEHIFARGVYHLGRGLAYINKDQLKKANMELSALQKAAATDLAAEEFVGFANAQSVLRIAEYMLAGELAVAKGKLDEGVNTLERAVRLEDSLTYNEPPDWMLPVRHHLGAVLLEADRADEAEMVYWEDLKRNPQNGYSLFGLHQAMIAQEKAGEAKTIQERFNKAWSKADTTLTTSRY